ncbi:MAG TPA: DNA polymerase III subunit delta [Saprospiraceae bacterium]|nr:DNA polymerase III subunit delta [Saprospiraceae bacterium]
MAIGQLQKDIKAGKIYPLYLLHGEESYLIDEAAEFLEAHLLQENEKAFDQQILYGMDMNVRFVIEQLMLFPLLAPRRVVFVREAQQLEDLKDLETYASRPAPSSVLILCHKGKSLDKRWKLYDAIKQKGFILAADRMKDKEVQSWLMDTASTLHIKLDPEAANLMIELIGIEISHLYPELKKLAISHSNIKPVLPADIIDLVGMSREYNAFELKNALESGDVKKTMQIGARMAEQKGYSIIPLIALLNGFYSGLLIVKSLGNASDAIIGEAMGNKSPWLIGKTKDAARRYTLENLERCIGWLHIYDMKSKGWNSSADDYALTVELLDHLLYPGKEPVFNEN